VTDFLPLQILGKFDRFLGAEGLEFKDAVCVGGAAIAAFHPGHRVTQDIDVLTPIPPKIKEASIRFAAAEGLAAEWFNNRVVNLASCKPYGWGQDVVPIYEGPNLTVYSVSRQNLLRIKTYAYCDRPEGPAIDLPDVLSMRPTQAEIDEASTWTLQEAQRQRLSKMDPASFKAALADLKERAKKS
jgi:hypothetical protein